MKAILPAQLLTDARKLATAVENALDGAALGAQADFDTTVATWKTSVDFVIVKTGDLSRAVGTNSEIYGYVNDGTRAHVIIARRGKRLKFRAGYRAKTTPGDIGSTGGGASGPTVFAERVQHPGTTARKFDEVIQAKWENELPNLVQRAIDAVV